MESQRAFVRRVDRILSGRYRRASPLATLWRIFDDHHMLLVWATFFWLIKHSPVWVLPVATAQVVDAVAEPTPDSMQTVFLYGGLILLLVLQNVPTHALFVRFLSRAIRSAQLLLRSALVTRLQQLSLSYHDEQQTGTIHAKVLRDVEQIEQLCRQMYAVVLSAFTGIAVALGVTLWNAPMVSLFFFVGIPASVLLVRVFKRNMRERTHEFRRELEAMSSQVSEMLAMIPITRAHGLEETEQNRLQTQLEKVRARGERLDYINSIFTASGWVTFQIANLGCLIFCAWFVHSGRLTVGALVQYTAYFALVLNNVQRLLNVYPMLVQGLESVESIGEVLECPDIEHNEGKRPVEHVQGAFCLDHVSFRYAPDGPDAVSDLSMDVGPGESLAFVGPSGGGKSTLMGLLIGFRRPTSGRILLDGRNMENLNLRDYRQFLAVVPQQTVLFSGSIRDNICYGLDCVDEGHLEEVLQMANVAEFLPSLPDGLETTVGEQGAKLSGGQRQRIAIARALIRDPRVIILDEATSALDVISEQLVQEAIDRLIEGRTTFIVAHRLSTIRNVDRVVVLKDGRAVESGSQSELLARNGEFARLKALQT